MATKVFRHCAELVTNAGVARKGGVRVDEHDLGIVTDGSLVWDDRKGVAWFGKTADLPKKYLSLTRSKKTSRDCSEQMISPALVDCHTHLVFAGNRADEWAQRLKGATYQQIAESGGGIVSSVRQFRKASEKTLLDDATERLEAMRTLGIGIVEIKSGYGLDLKNELKALRVAQQLKRRFRGKMEIQVTFLGAHAFPPEAQTAQDREAYVDTIVKKMIPAVARQKLADACDVFFDQGYFDEAQSRRILAAARAKGLLIKLHADELVNTGGAALAAELGAMSADHLLRADDDGLAKMAQKGVVAVLLPTTAFFLGLPYAPFQKMNDAGVCVALATDFNPGSSPTFNLPFVMTLACLKMGMQMHEAFAAATYGGARALGMHLDQGFIEVGKKPRLARFSCSSFRVLISDFAHPGRCEEIW